MLQKKAEFKRQSFPDLSTNTHLQIIGQNSDIWLFLASRESDTVSI
jgi:hypothetical protein